jgi:hypothetical protein
VSATLKSLHCIVFVRPGKRHLVLDGVYRCDAGGVPALVEVDAPTDNELHAVPQMVITRLMKMLMRCGALIGETGQTYLAAPDADGQ